MGLIQSMVYEINLITSSLRWLICPVLEAILDLETAFLRDSIAVMQRKNGPTGWLLRAKIEST